MVGSLLLITCVFDPFNLMMISLRAGASRVGGAVARLFCLNLLLVLMLIYEHQVGATAGFCRLNDCDGSGCTECSP